METEYRQLWEAYVKKEMAGAAPFLAELGLTLNREQIHIGGERYLQSGRKLVLTGCYRTNNQRAVIKISSDSEGKREIKHEYKTRQALINIKFAYRTFLFPKELVFAKRGRYLIYATAYIEQKNPFLARPLDEQFFLALRAFETQESYQATASSHLKTIRGKFDEISAPRYLSYFDEFEKNILDSDPGNKKVAATLRDAKEKLRQHMVDIERYGGFLVHSDFVPHNFRVSNREIYVLDCVAIHFGNKYEGWARFLNFMLLYNRPLETALTQYIRQNRGEDEYLILQLMRLYKIGFLLRFHAGTLKKTSGDLTELARRRVDFWTDALRSIINDRPLAQEIIETFVQKRNSLRSETEKKRQKEIGHIVN